MGKSSLASNIAVNFAKKELPVVFFTMEMTETEVLQRMILHTSMVSRKEILQGDKEAAEQAVEAAESICKMPIYIDERSGLSVQQIKAQCYGVKKREGQIGLIVIDGEEAAFLNDLQRVDGISVATLVSYNGEYMS